MSDNKIELVARFFWERSGKFRWSELSGDLKESALDCVRKLEPDMAERFYDAIEFGRKLEWSANNLVPMYEPGKHGGPIENAEELFK